MYPGEELEFINGSLVFGNAQLVLQFTRGCDFHTCRVQVSTGKQIISGALHTKLIFLHFLFLKVVQWMRTASVCPHIWEGNLLRGSLLQ